MIRAPLPDRVDLDEPSEQKKHRGDREQQANRAQRVGRPHRSANNIALSLPAPRRGSRLAPRGSEDWPPPSAP